MISFPIIFFSFIESTLLAPEAKPAQPKYVLVSLLWAGKTLIFTDIPKPSAQAHINSASGDRLPVFISSFRTSGTENGSGVRRRLWGRRTTATTWWRGNPRRSKDPPLTPSIQVIIIDNARLATLFHSGEKILRTYDYKN